MKKQYIFLFLIIIGSKGVTQQPSPDSLTIVTANKYAVESLKEKARSFDFLYQGIEYLSYGHGIDGHPYFETDSFRQGSVRYKGLEFDDSRLLYDIARDQIIIPNRYSNGMLQLVTAKISSFSIGQRSFVKITADTTQMDVPAEGFYELAYNDKTTRLFVKHQKEVKVPAKTDAKPFFNYTATYFVQKDNRFHAIKNEKDVLALMPGKKVEIKKIVKEQHLSFRKNKKVYLITVLNHFLKD